MVWIALHLLVGAAIQRQTSILIASGGSDVNLNGGNLQECTQTSDATPTGFDRTGSCVWDEDDSGYHQVCVKMSADFLQKSAQQDGNDLSSVVSPGGHW